MYRITVQMVIQLIAKVKGITLPINENNERLLPFGCKLTVHNHKFFIKHYAYDKSDLNQLIEKFPFLKS
jgi:hypothetical protein